MAARHHPRRPPPAPTAPTAPTAIPAPAQRPTSLSSSLNTTRPSPPSATPRSDNASPPDCPAASRHASASTLPRCASASHDPRLGADSPSAECAQIVETQDLAPCAARGWDSLLLRAISERLLSDSAAARGVSRRLICLGAFSQGIRTTHLSRLSRRAALRGGFCSHARPAASSRTSQHWPSQDGSPRARWAMPPQCPIARSSAKAACGCRLLYSRCDTSAARRCSSSRRTSTDPSSRARRSTDRHARSTCSHRYDKISPNTCLQRAGERRKR